MATKRQQSKQKRVRGIVVGHALERDRNEALRQVLAADNAIRRDQDALDQAVRVARRLGVTWAEIGQELDTTRQAAQLRFRHVGEDVQLPLTGDKGGQGSPKATRRAPSRRARP
jgi:hypothetical protein